jgi:DNA polymerase
MIAAALSPDAVYEDWRTKARAFIAAGARPEQIAWGGTETPDLFGGALSTDAKHTDIVVTRAFVDVARKAALHSDANRFALLYRVLWRLQSNRALMEDAADADVAQLLALAKAVRRDEHKMHAFVRFKEIETQSGPRFIAWFEPQHHILRETADFFVRRFAGMNWSILTPEASAHWDGMALTFGPGGRRADVPAEDARDEDWRAYYASMFNPTRLRTAAMRREMPKHYWRNLPEAETIPSLVKSASLRTEHMVAASPTTPRKRSGAAHRQVAPEDLPARLEHVAEHAAAPKSMADLQRALSACRACPLWKDATQAVPGEGPLDRPLLALVGEQPGDQEDLAGRPFVGPAGKVLDRALAQAGIDRKTVFVTNAVKHFKHEQQGKRRLHKRPNKGEIEICRWWVSHELALIKPRLVVALGATALHSLAGYAGTMESARGQPLKTREGAALRATIHPSYLLRLQDHDEKEAQYARFVGDLKKAKAAAARLKAA